MNPSGGNLTAIILTVWRDVMRALKLAAYFVFNHVYGVQRLMRTAHPPGGFRGFLFRYSHDESLY
jgi:hypothetical protein